MRAALNTSVMISALIKPGGLESAALLLALDGRYELCASEPIRAEYGEVLRRPRFSRWLDPHGVRDALIAIERAALLVHPGNAVTVCTQEPDNRFLECAEAAQAGFLVTGNRRHFPKAYGSTLIASTREFLGVLFQPRG